MKFHIILKLVLFASIVGVSFTTENKWITDIAYDSNRNLNKLIELNGSLYYQSEGKKNLISDKEGSEVESISLMSQDGDKKIVLVAWRNEGRGRYLSFELLELYPSSPFFNKLTLPKEMDSYLPDGTVETVEKEVNVSYALNYTFQSENSVRNTMSFKFASKSLTLVSNDLSEVSNGQDYINVAEHFQKNGDFKKSIAHYKRGLKKLKKESKFVEETMIASINLKLATAYLANSDTRQAKKLLRDISNSFSDIGLGRKAKKILSEI